MNWKCPKCSRSFTRPNQRHRCGTGDSASILRDRPEQIQELYRDLETFANSLGNVEIVARERYALFRSKKIFTDLSVMKACLRVAIHLGENKEVDFFEKVVSDRKHHSHIAKLHNAADLERAKPYIAEAYEFSLGKSS